MLTPYQPGTGPGLALLASYLLQPAATPVIRYGKNGHGGQYTPTGVDSMDELTPPVGGGHYGQPHELSYTEIGGVRVPLRPPKTPHPWGCLLK